MSEAISKLNRDLKILEAMAAEMDDYLNNTGLFWPLSDSNMPRLTLGGYLMRQHRLSKLTNLLDDEEKHRLDLAVGEFNEALVDRVVRFEKRAHEELHARLRQWSEYLKELPHESMRMGDYYASSVDTRLMIAALINRLSLPPYELDKNAVEEIRAYDRALQNYWQPGDFILPEEWQQAYSRKAYWWLYGRPKTDGKQ